MKSVFLVGAGVVSSLLAASAGRAAILYQTGFEQPQFTPGAIDGQGGWAYDGTIESSTVYDGTQALEIDAQSDTRYLVADLGLAITTAGNVVKIQLAMLRTGSGETQAGFGLWGDTGFIGQVSSGNGSDWIGNTSHASNRVAISDDVWHQVTFTLNFRSDRMSGSIDGRSIGMLAINNTTMPTTITDLALNSYGAGSGTPQKMFFDNLTVASVPEPSSWAMMLGGFGAVGAGLRRRKAGLSFG